MKKYEESLHLKKPKKREAKQSISKYDIIKKHHKFLRESDSDSEESAEKNQQKTTKKMNDKEKKEVQQEKVAKQYYDSLYKEYTIVDLSRYETGQIGCRWRTEKQVIKNKGERLCAALKCNKESIKVYEMNFGYVEEGVKKNALVKVSVCQQCGVKLNHSKKLKELYKKVKIQE